MQSWVIMQVVTGPCHPWAHGHASAYLCVNLKVQQLAGSQHVLPEQYRHYWTSPAVPPFSAKMEKENKMRIEVPMSSQWHFKGPRAVPNELKGVQSEAPITVLQNNKVKGEKYISRSPLSANIWGAHIQHSKVNTCVSVVSKVLKVIRQVLFLNLFTFDWS